MNTVRSPKLVSVLAIFACIACSASERADEIQRSNDPSASGGGGASSSSTVGGGGVSLTTTGAGGEGGFAACATSSIVATRVPLDMYIMVDRSGSMSADGKWTSVTHALESFAVSAKPSDVVAMGLQYFPLTVPIPCSNGACPDGGICWNGFCPATIDSCAAADYAKPAVDITAVPQAAQAMKNSLEGQTPTGSGTPTAPALQGALDEGSAWRMTHADHTVVVVLATDGVPTECSPTSIGEIASIAATGYAGGIPTFVIGVGVAHESLDAIAQYGGTVGALFVDTGGDTTSAFVAALDQVRHTASGCAFQLPTDASADPLKVNVKLTYGGVSATLPKADDASQCAADMAWYYDDPSHPTKIVLCPAACDAFEGSVDGSIEIVVGCATIIK